MRTSVVTLKILDALLIYQIEVALWYFTAPPGTPFPRLEEKNERDG